MEDSTGREDESGAGAAQRRHPRFEVALRVIVRVLVEEQTFTPFQLPGTCHDISLSGALVEVEGLTRPSYNTLIQRQRYVRLICSIPGHEQPVMLFGRIVWFDYQGESEPMACRMGIAFEAMKEETTSLLTAYLDSIRQSAPNAPSRPPLGG
jgi:hypothetical protein